MEQIIRWMVRRDMKEVLAIEKNSFEFPFTPEDFENELRRRDVVGMVSEVDGEVAGYILYSIRKHRMDIVVLAVAEKRRRQGVGERLVNMLKGKVNNQNKRRIRTHVRETNLPALIFFRKHGFLATTILKDFYETDCPDDCYVMEWEKEKDGKEAKETADSRA